jgi:ribA/ribD-fused uncharacterized protein
MGKINSFNGSYRFLSNFFIEPDGTHVEGEYQASKCQVPEQRVAFRGLSPGAAKRMGRRINLRPDWYEIRLEVMHKYVEQKFLDHPTLASALVNTGDAELVEGNTWGDRFWGECGGVGENHLGKILMSVRKELKRALY